MTGRIVTTNVVFSTELGGRSTALTTHVVYPSYFPVPVTTFFTSAATLVDGRPTVYTVSATYFELPRALFSGSTSTATSTSAFGNTTFHSDISTPPPTPLLPPPTPPPPATTQSKAWVAGPAVGGMAVIVILALLGSWWRRKRRQRLVHSINVTTPEPNAKFEKPELPGWPAGGVSRQEINGIPIQELEDGRPYRDGDADVHEAGGAGVHEVETEQVTRSGVMG
ncbi:hypothetical protein PG996_004894 [Apiospora saccharicola]|uniref:Uncharacterized protein n=1 Tax=Apiospora saccharicola TaxID=335842 RepID=A0ABR1VJX9_9PEZI